MTTEQVRATLRLGIPVYLYPNGSHAGGWKIDPETWEGLDIISHSRGRTVQSRILPRAVRKHMKHKPHNFTLTPRTHERL
jgi:hypothetical protein